MATLKAEGVWGATILGGKAGMIDGVMNVQINAQIDDGPSKGMRCTYEDTVNARSAKYIGWSCSAAGWKGRDLITLEGDIAEWIKATGGHSTVEIKHIPTKVGTPEQGIWDKCNGIGRNAPKPMKAPSASVLADANAAMQAAMGGPPPDDVPHSGMEDSDIPFIHRGEVSALAKVLR